MPEIVILDHFKKSLWESEDKRFIVEQGGAGSGKAVPLDTRVITPDGYKLMGDIEIGDFVCNSYGGVSRVTDKWNNSPRKIYEITFEDGRTVRCADNHQWVFFKEDGNPIVGDTQELINCFNYNATFLPLPFPVFFENAPADVLPLLMGLILGTSKKMNPEDFSNITIDDLQKNGIIK